MPLEEVCILPPVRAKHGALARLLLAADDGEGGPDAADRDKVVPGAVLPRHRKLQVPRGEELGGALLQVDGLGLLLHPVRHAEDLEVALPSLREVVVVAAAHPSLQPLLPLGRVGAHLGDKQRVALRDRARLHLRVEGEEHVLHPLRVANLAEEAGRLVQTLCPHLVPQDGHAYELRGDEGALIHQFRVHGAHAAQERLRGVPPHRVRRLARHREGVNEHLRVLPADAKQEVVDGPPDPLVRQVDAGDDLGDHLEPSVDGEGADGDLERLRHLPLPPVLEPEREEAERVLQAVPLAPQRDALEEAPDGLRHQGGELPGGGGGGLGCDIVKEGQCQPMPSLVPPRVQLRRARQGLHHAL
mmetsp:Transcript_22586/g.57085  ORF Transcript_22586/g.57085 Transcript_22586/m.57085 type:complete len:358 (-) Transcript_22586:28-1101(-)